MIRTASRIFAVFALCLAASCAFAQDKVVYHFDDAAKQATRGLRAIGNHLDVAPQTKIVVVADGEGVDFLIRGARDKTHADVMYESLVAALKARGVRFEVCEVTLRSRELQKSQFIQDAGFTASGVARVAQLRSREGYAYISP